VCVRLIKHLFLSWAIASSIAWVSMSPALAADSAVVLMYHRFGEDRHPTTSIRIDQFEDHLEHLRDGGYTVIPLSTLLAALEGGSSDLPERAVVITIDDAYRSVYEIALPRFKEHAYPFTVFVATDPVDGGLGDYMTWEQMREMQKSGTTFANHGAGHISLVERANDESHDAWRARIGADIERGQRRLDDELDPLSHAFAYPYGEYNDDVADMLAEMGYVSFGQQSGAVGPRTDRRAVPRYPMAEKYGDLSQFDVKVASLPLPVTTVEPWNPVTELACYVSGQGRVGVEWLEAEKRFRVGPSAPFETGRQRVNCTAPTSSGRFQWFSHPWIIESP
jgi:peptidoglycan/xylan/chitin deacetylase (PgdA/CDA1 family)